MEPMNNPDAQATADRVTLATHRALLAQLRGMKDEVADAVRRERERGATMVQLMQAAGFDSINPVRMMLRPELRDRHNENRRHNRPAA